MSSNKCLEVVKTVIFVKTVENNGPMVSVTPLQIFLNGFGLSIFWDLKMDPLVFQFF